MPEATPHFGGHAAVISNRHPPPAFSSLLGHMKERGHRAQARRPEPEASTVSKVPFSAPDSRYALNKSDPTAVASGTF